MASSLDGGWADPIGRQDMPQEFDAILEEETLGAFCMESVAIENFKDLISDVPRALTWFWRRSKSHQGKKRQSWGVQVYQALEGCRGVR